jgi:hypothetical protein
LNYHKNVIISKLDQEILQNYLREREHMIGFARARGDENGAHDVGFLIARARARGDENGVQDVGFLIARAWP